MKVRAAVQAAKESGIVVMARTDCRPTAGFDEAVARGAALFPANLLQIGRPVPFQLANVSTHSLGIEGVDPVTGQYLVNDVGEGSC